jgi:hypothetical protein
MGKEEQHKPMMHGGSIVGKRQLAWIVRHKV